jgi:hypothetical protein
MCFLRILPSESEMTTKAGLIACRLTVLLLCLSVAGCYIPGGGWTMRAGVDLRRRKKPSAFFEMVDTRWDEYNRIAEINMFTTSSVSSASFAPATGPGMEGVPAPPASGSKILSDSSVLPPPSDDNLPPRNPTLPEADFHGNSTLDGPTAGEPTRLPGADETSGSTPLPGDDPTARQSELDEPPSAPLTSDDSTIDAVAVAAPARTPAARRSRRPMASRLFSRPK